jgi:hypothetical protein
VNNLGQPGEAAKKPAKRPWNAGRFTGIIKLLLDGRGLGKTRLTPMYGGLAGNTLMATGGGI